MESARQARAYNRAMAADVSPHGLRGAWSALDRDRRFAGAAAAALLATMFLPWYEKSTVPQGSREFVKDTVSAFGVVSFVEAAIFLVSAGVLVLVIARGQGRPFHLPGGDGTVIFAAGLWAALLIFYRVFDRPDVSGQAGTVGIQWGFFLAFVAAGALAYAGQRIRLAGAPEPPLRAAEPEPTDATEPVAPSEALTELAPSRRARARRRHVTREDARQLAFDEPADPPPAPGEVPPARERP